MKIEPIKTTKSVKHTFNPEERNQIGGDLARAIAGLRGTEAEFDQVKASYKAKTTEHEAKIDSLSTALMNGFELRNERCVVLYRPADRKKDYYLEKDYAQLQEGELVTIPAVLIEDMTADDFQAELLQAEAQFECREELPLFQPANGDSGILVVGRLNDRWFTALRVSIGKCVINERLDSEQRSYKKRADAVKEATRRVSQWAKDNLKEAAKGFEDGFRAVSEAQKEREE
jgi:hypothetical protein